MELNQQEMDVVKNTVTRELNNIVSRNKREKKLAKYFSPDYQFAGGSFLTGERAIRGTNLAGCGICVSRAAYKLEQGMTFDEMKQMIKSKHPELTDLTRYTQRFIRFVTGEGFDEWIVQHEDRMWKVKNPVVYPNQEIRWLFGMRWVRLVENGRKIYDMVHKLNTNQYTEEELKEHIAFCEAYGISKEKVVSLMK